MHHLFIQFYQLTIKFWNGFYKIHFYKRNSSTKNLVVEFSSRAIINTRIMPKLDKHCVYCSHFRSVEIKPFKMITASFIQHMQYERVCSIVPVSLLHDLCWLRAHTPGLSFSFLVFLSSPNFLLLFWMS